MKDEIPRSSSDLLPTVGWFLVVFRRLPKLQRGSSCQVKKNSQLTSITEPISRTTLYKMAAEGEGKTNDQLQDDLDGLNAKVTAQGATVRTLKKEGGSADDIAEAVAALQALKIQSTELTKNLEADRPKFNRRSFDDLVLRKMFVVPSFEIHGGVKGLFDLGPPSCALKVSFLSFVHLRESMHVFGPTNLLLLLPC
jgi:hypothetical protein